MLTHNEQITVESPTVEEALAEISAKLGPDVEIVGAQKVVRGGLAGFFSREMVQISARPARIAETSNGAVTNGVERAIEQIRSAADEEEGTFQNALREQLGIDTDVAITLPGPDDAADDVRVELTTPTVRVDPGPADEAAAVAAMLAGPPATAPAVVDPPGVIALETPPLPQAPPAPEPAGSAVRSTGDVIGETVRADAARQHEQDDQGDLPTPGWSVEALIELGLPPSIVRAAEGLDSAGDLDWVAAITQAVADLCGPLPARPTVYAGPGAHHLAGRLGLASVRPGDPVPATDDFCATTHVSDAAWLRSAKGDRSLHLVLGDEDWRGLLIEHPVAVSWTNEAALPSALYVAAALGVPVGFGGSGGFPVDVTRVNAVDTALAIRRLVRRR